MAENKQTKKVFNSKFVFLKTNRGKKVFNKFDFVATNWTFFVVFLQSFCATNATNLMPCLAMDKTSVSGFSQITQSSGGRAPLSLVSSRSD